MRISDWSSDVCSSDLHPSYAGVSLGLLHGAQPDALVLCHEPGRPHMRGLPHYPVPDLATCLEANLQAARLTSPDVIAVGVAVNTSNLGGADAAARVCAEIEDALGLPCQDPVTMGMARIANRLQSCFASRSEEHTSELQSLMRI